MSLILGPEIARAIRDAGLAAYPHECCGFLLGRLEDGHKRVTDLRAADNSREPEARRNRFLITPESYRDADREARAAGLDVLGFYHSHPDAPAIPSAYDLDHAWPWYSYVIVSIAKRHAQQMSCWVLAEDRGRFSAEPLEIVEDGRTRESAAKGEAAWL
jgi:proteasome lid subunit RPN8/RPN11